MCRICVARTQLNATIFFTCRSTPKYVPLDFVVMYKPWPRQWVGPLGLPGYLKASKLSQLLMPLPSLTTFNIIIFITISISILVIIIIIIIIPVVMPAAILHPMRPSPLVWPELSTYTRFTGLYAPILKIEFELLPSLQSVRLLALQRLIGNKNLLWCHPAVLSMFTVIVCIHCIHSL